MSRHILSTGQWHCYHETGVPVTCSGSGQDAEFRPGITWPCPRFTTENGTAHDLLTGLVWSQDANPGEFPCTWQQALAAVKELNKEKYCGRSDWRLPNRRELRSLMDYQTKKPSLPRDHPFTNVFIHWYWSSTTAVIHPGYAWCVHLEGARMFYGKKTQEAMFWPVGGKGNNMLAATGQQQCYNPDGKVIPCGGSCQDGELRFGASWPTPRFVLVGDGRVRDELTGLTWWQGADVTAGRVSWQQALTAVRNFKISEGQNWRLPTINELESLVDADNHSPALPQGHPFNNLRDGYWSSTTSFFETDWAWVLYLDKGACGVGYKPDATFHVWPVMETKDDGVAESVC